ncbi:MAG TPA: RNA-binding cell elongation regulator Jag/EloR [Bacilli bacterium]|nr:RNA-binding cell elongation regulator Jag/EloR [Bacilli bacterium]HQA19188.1 RNA-binding cell elongation regulator Jag/EloR [Bacilli bacterium]HQD91896.1 RNA-binding cell elongation regulator Jag/EloR [Bacilli bacterium]
MIKRVYEVKTLEEAQELAVKDLNLSLDDLNFEVVSEKKGFLGLGGKLTVEVSTKIDGITRGKEYLKAILKNMKINGFIETKVRGNVVNYNIETHENNGYLIGKNGKNLLAIQSLLVTVVNNFYDEGETKTVVLDIGEYKSIRKRQLEKLAVTIGKQVARTKQPAVLDNLNAYERKIIHTKLASWKDVKTHSEGIEPNRHLIISPK